MISSVNGIDSLNRQFTSLSVDDIEWQFIDKTDEAGKSLGKDVQSEKKSEAESKKKIENADGASTANWKSVVAKKVSTIKNAHADDVHAVIRVSQSHFVTGGKDGCLKMWNSGNRSCKDVFTPAKTSYESWITALAVIGSNQWISGTRDAYVDLWDNSGKHLASFSETVCPVLSSSHKSKDRNLRRANCLKGGLTPDVFYVGWPTQLTIHKIITEESTKELYAQTIGFCSTDSNDWVFSVTPLTEKRLLVVTGAKLEIWETQDKLNAWKKTAALIKEVKKAGMKRHQRPFISDVVPFQGQKNWYGLAVFGGAVKVIDVEAQKEVASYKEHKDRVWTINDIVGANLFGSCSDDHTIKLWDVRVSKSLSTLTGNIGRVSTLLTLSDLSFLSGSCPDNLNNTKERAQITFWDLRKT